jgi:tungstate transport system ATP-binding protein
MNLFHLEKINKKYKDRIVLNIPELDIEEKLIIALLGPNGSGKTTLMNILAFLELPTNGKIWYKNKPVRFTRAEIHELRREIVMVGQHPILFSTTVFKNLEFGLKIRKISPKKRKYIIEETLELVGMRNFAQAPAMGLSGGETQRVALARAIALSPKTFLCDEPTSSVDVENQAIIVKIIKQLNATKQISIVFTTHDRSLAASLSNQTLTLDHGLLM